MTRNRIPVVIAGATGTGKSDLAFRIALALGGEIVNYDSVQVYRGFDIGSAKPPAAVRATLPHHLFDIVDADEEFNAADFGRRARATCDAIAGRGNVAVLAGGTFFYLRAFLSDLPEIPGRDAGLRRRIRSIAASARGAGRLHRWLTRVDPVSGRRIAPGDRHRVERALEVWLTTGRPISSWDRPTSGSAELPSLKIALNVERAELHRRLDERVESMYRDGLIEETRALLKRFPSTARPFGTIGYKEAVAVVNGTLAVDAAIAETRRRTRAYAKRQLTWLRSERNVHWIDGSDRDKSLAAALRLIEVES